MKRIILLSIGLFLACASIAQEQVSDIQVQKLGEGWYRLVLKSFQSGSVEAGQAELLPKAREVCSGDSVRYGKYQFETSEAISPSTAEKRPLLLRQEIHCGDTPIVPTAPTANTDAPWKPTLAEQQEVERLTYAYFSARDSANYGEAYSLMSPSQQASMPFEHWRSLMDAFNAKAGGVLSRRIKKVTWYKDPPGTPAGVYAAVDFASQFANIEIHCGYVAWQRQPDNTFRLIREEENYLDKAIQQKLNPNDLATVRAKFGC